MVVQCPCRQTLSCRTIKVQYVGLQESFILCIAWHSSNSFLEVFAVPTHIGNVGPTLLWHIAQLYQEAFRNLKIVCMIFVPSRTGVSDECHTCL